MTFRLADWLEDFETGRRQVMHLTVTQAVLQAVTQLELFHHLDMPMPVEALAARVGVRQQGLSRILSFLAAEGVVEWDGIGDVAPNAKSVQVQALASTISNYRMPAEAGLVLDQALRDGSVAFDIAKGMPVFEYLRQDAEAAAIFADVMRVTTREVESYLFAHYDFPAFTCAVDVGANQGSLLRRLLNENPGTSGVLFDLPATASSAGASLAGTELEDRITCVGGSFFDEVPGGGDLYLLKQILHDWSDEEGLQILSTIRKAMAPGVPLVVIERLMPDVPAPCEAVDVDILMMLWTTGRERTAAAYTGMLEQTGFEVRRIVGETGGQGVLEAIAV